MNRHATGSPSVAQKLKSLRLNRNGSMTALAHLLPIDDPVIRQLPSSVRIFCVGGAVRDALLGEPDADRDYVVVGATVDQMLAAGFTPVGKDFPVFLHPNHHDEYALARTERKSGSGYKGFVFNTSPDVTLEEDLSRRDLTINAMAVDPTGNLIDPFHGRADLESKIFRHIGPAFSEDPVRLLRLARFAARWPEFSIAPETLRLCQEIVARGETRALVAERVWQELAKGLMENRPSEMIRTLQQCGAWPDLIRAENTSITIGNQTLDILDRAAQAQYPIEMRYALLIHNCGATLAAETFKAPKSCSDLAALLIAQSLAWRDLNAALQAPPSIDAAAILLEWMSRADVIRKPDRFEWLLNCLALEGLINETDRTLLHECATLLTSPGTAEAVAQAAQSAAANNADVAAAAQGVRLQALKTHPRLGR